MQGLMPAPDYFFSKPITTSGENGKKRLFWSHFDNKLTPFLEKKGLLGQIFI